MGLDEDRLEVASKRIELLRGGPWIPEQVEHLLGTRCDRA
jgi:hypothetical protein